MTEIQLKELNVPEDSHLPANEDAARTKVILRHSRAHSTSTHAAEKVKEPAKPIPASIRTVFILVSITIVVLVILRNLILTTRMVLGEWKCRKPSTDFHPGRHKDVQHYDFDRLSDILLIPTGFLHIPEYIYLMVFLYKFIGVYINWEPRYKKELWSEMRKFVCMKKKTLRILLNGIVLMLMLLVALLLPPICIIRLHIQGNVTEEYCSKRLAFVQHSLTHAFHGVSFFTNTVVALTRWLMVFFTVMVGVMWRRVKPSRKDHHRQTQERRFSKALTDSINYSMVNQVAILSPGSPPHQEPRHETNPQVPKHEVNPQESGNNSQDPGHKSDKTNPQESAHDANDQNHQHDANDWEAVCCRHTQHIIEYMAIKEKVFPIYKIFRSFFVLQWIIHLFGLFCHIAHLVRPWIRNGQVHNANMLIITHQIYQLLYILYNGLALIISYICALKMNAYLRRYVREVQQKQLDEAAQADSKMQYSLTHMFLVKVESVSKSSFVPRIPGTGLSISVESPGFVLSVVFSVFALIGALVSF